MQPHSLEGLQLSKKTIKDKKNSELENSLSKLYSKNTVKMNSSAQKRQRTKSVGHKKMAENLPAITLPVKAVRRVKSVSRK